MIQDQYGEYGEEEHYGEYGQEGQYGEYGQEEEYGEYGQEDQEGMIQDQYGQYAQYDQYGQYGQNEEYDEYGQYGQYGQDQEDMEEGYLMSDNLQNRYKKQKGKLVQQKKVGYSRRINSGLQKKMDKRFHICPVHGLYGQGNQGNKYGYIESRKEIRRFKGINGGVVDPVISNNSRRLICDECGGNLSGLGQMTSNTQVVIKSCPIHGYNKVQP